MKSLVLAFATACVLLLGACKEGAGPTLGSDVADPFDPDRMVKEQMICLKDGGIWAKRKSGAQFCSHQTGEAAKGCSSGRDCKGECLARSKSCSPFAPITGCQEVINDGGLVATLCVD